jgi:hypothetical protein
MFDLVIRRIKYVRKFGKYGGFEDDQVGLYERAVEQYVEVLYFRIIFVMMLV